MDTQILRIDKENIDQRDILKGGEVIRYGGLVAFPTETVYGLGANALSADAAGKIYAAKGRPSDNPLIVHIADISALHVIARDVSDRAMRLAKRFWPGPLTLIFKKTDAVPLATTGGLLTVAVRMPKNDIALALIRASGGYIAAPSANISGRPSPTSAAHVAGDLGGKIDMILDGGDTDIGVESTIVDMTVDPPAILRPGAITRKMMEAVIGAVRGGQEELAGDTDIAVNIAADLVSADNLPGAGDDIRREFSTHHKFGADGAVRTREERRDGLSTFPQPGANDPATTENKNAGGGEAEDDLSRIVGLSAKEESDVAGTADGEFPGDGDHPKAPGMKYRHYAPKAEMMLVDGQVSDMVRAIRQLAYEKTRQGHKVGIIASFETAGSYTKGTVKPAGSRSETDTVAKNLYRILREFDDEGVSYIYSETFPDSDMGEVVMNRLIKAAGHRIERAADIIKPRKYLRVLFISKYDTCRGPMAATLLAKEDLLREYEIGSRGVAVLFPEPVNQKAEAIVRSHRLTMLPHEAKAFTEDDLDETTLVLTLDEPLKWKIISDYENVRNVYTLSEFIDDDRQLGPLHGEPLSVYEKNYELLAEFTAELAQKLNSSDEA